MNKDKFLAKYNDILSNYNDLAACVRRQLNYNYPYKPCLDDKNEIFCEDVIDVYTCDTSPNDWRRTELPNF